MQHVADFPTSFAQERVWVLQHLDPASRAYHFQATLAFDGALDLDALAGSLKTLVARHAIFRTTFPSYDGHPMQRVHTDAPFELPVVDLTQLEMSAAESALRGEIAAELAHRFDLERLPLVRWKLVRMRADRHVLIHLEHHLLHDGWSFYVFLEELAALYRAFAAGEPITLAPLPLQFGEVAAMERDRERAGAFADQLAYWRGRLAGAPPALRLPTDRPRPPVPGYHGASVWLDIPPSLGSALTEIGRRMGCTPFMTLYAAFAVLLHRYTGEVDICVGTGVAARRPGTEKAIGMLVNNVTLRTDLAGDPPFTDLLARVRATTLDAYANQDVPFDRVVEAVAPVRDRSIHPLFSLMFSFHDSPSPDLSLPKASVKLTQALDNDTAKFDLNVIAIPHEDGASLRWEYNRDLFDRETIERMAEHFRHLLRSIAAEPERRISRLPMMAEAERRLLLEFGGTPTPYERDASIHELFEAQAARTPDAIAVEGDGFTLTYAELDARANRLARHLHAHGVGPERTVGLALERSAALPVAVLGILKAGGAYVPLDAGYPRERLEFMLADAAIRFIVTERSLYDRLPLEGTRVVLVDEDAAEIAAESARPLGLAIGPEALAYVIYTSGSTGRPKGVAIVHRGVVRLVRAADSVEVAPDDVFLQFAPLSFDASTFEIFAPLLNGARLALAPPGPRSLAEIAATIERFGVTTLWLTAPLFHRMVESELPRLSGLRRLLTGGDVVSAAHARRFLEALPGCRLIDAYGPTENTTFSTSFAIPAAAEIAHTVPIGRPVANSTAYVLDRHLNLVPFGVQGELCVGGDGLARGYLNAPELTAERFVSNPFAADPSERLYRTGDRARLRRDGVLEFLGRLDQQVKIRGFRIEPGEIEAVLRAHEALREAAVAIVEKDGERSLAAWVVPADGSHVDERSLRSFLRTKLPEHMVPEHIVLVAHLSEFSSGKLDRKALASALPERRPEAVDGTPRTPTESALAVMIAGLLAREHVARDDDVFALGMHSLLAMRIVARIAQQFGVDMALRELFDHPTVAELAERIDAAPRRELRAADAPIARRERSTRPAMVFGRSR
jgi:aspartate racemase